MTKLFDVFLDDKIVDPDGQVIKNQIPFGEIVAESDGKFLVLRDFGGQRFSLKSCLPEEEKIHEAEKYKITFIDQVICPDRIVSKKIVAGTLERQTNGKLILMPSMPLVGGGRYVCEPV